MYPRHVYVHVPFCARRCAYCDFSIAVRNVVPVGDYLAALEAELALRYPERGAWEAETLYFGGGTPSRLGGPGLADAVERVRRRVSLVPGAEVTIEANPEDVTADALARWRDAGVNRVSLGVQSFDPRVLEWMHRVHGAERAAAAAETIRAGGIDDWSIDLIFALPEFLGRDWGGDLERALALRPAHVSLYGLTVEAQTPLGRWHARGDVIEAPEERYERDFLEAHARVTAAGLDHYEVSNFGRPGQWARHNFAYWRDVPYAGLGPSAHEYDGVSRRWNVAPYAAWQQLLAAGKSPVAGEEVLTGENRTAESVYLGLRTVRGLVLREGEDEIVQPWISAGSGAMDDDRLVLSPEGWLRLDALAGTLTHLRSR